MLLQGPESSNTVFISWKTLIHLQKCSQFFSSPEALSHCPFFTDITLSFDAGRAPLDSASSSMHSVVLSSSLLQHFLGLSAHSLSFHLLCPGFLPSSFFQPFRPSPTGSRRKWKEDVEENGFSFAGIRWAPTPQEEGGQKPLSLQVLRAVTAQFSSLPFLSLPPGSWEKHLMQPQCWQKHTVPELWWGQSSPALAFSASRVCGKTVTKLWSFRSGAFALSLKNFNSVWTALPNVFLITPQVWKCWE